MRCIPERADLDAPGGPGRQGGRRRGPRQVRLSDRPTDQGTMYIVTWNP